MTTKRRFPVNLHILLAFAAYWNPLLWDLSENSSQMLSRYSLYWGSKNCVEKKQSHVCKHCHIAAQHADLREKNATTANQFSLSPYISATSAHRNKCSNVNLNHLIQLKNLKLINPRGMCHTKVDPVSTRCVPSFYVCLKIYFLFLQSLFVLSYTIWIQKSPASFSSACVSTIQACHRSHQYSIPD